MWIIAWIIGSIIAGAICSDKKFGFWGTFFISLIISPIIGLIVGLVSGDAKAAAKAQYEANTPIWEKHLADGKRLDFKQRYAEAIDKYQDFLFDMERDTRKWSPTELVRKEKVTAEITARIKELQEMLNGKAPTQPS